MSAFYIEDFMWDNKRDSSPYGKESLLYKCRKIIPSYLREAY